MIFKELPYHVKLSIFSFLTPKQRLKLGLVCKEWNKLAQENSLYLQLLDKETLDDILKVEQYSKLDYKSIFKLLLSSRKKEFFDFDNRGYRQKIIDDLEEAIDALRLNYPSVTTDKLKFKKKLLHPDVIRAICKKQLPLEYVHVILKIASVYVLPNSRYPQNIIIDELLKLTEALTSAKTINIIQSHYFPIQPNEICNLAITQGIVFATSLIKAIQEFEIEHISNIKIFPWDRILLLAKTEMLVVHSHSDNLEYEGHSGKFISELIKPDIIKAITDKILSCESILDIIEPEYEDSCGNPVFFMKALRCLLNSQTLLKELSITKFMELAKQGSLYDLYRLIKGLQKDEYFNKVKNKQISIDTLFNQVKNSSSLFVDSVFNPIRISEAFTS